MGRCRSRLLPCQTIIYSYSTEPVGRSPACISPAIDSREAAVAVDAQQPHKRAAMSFELNKRLAAKREPLPSSAKVDPVTAGIIRGAFETVCFEAATHLGRAASSPIINQSNERNGSVLDAHGRLAGVSIGTPHLVFISQLTARYGLEHFDDYDWGPGDVFLGNDPDYGGGHLPDYNVYAPVFDDKGELILIQALQAHQGDTGGKDPGGFTLEATDIFTEGLAIPCLKLVHRGEKRRDVIKLLERNNRFSSFAGDLAAMIGAVQHCVKLLEDVVRKWGSEVVKAAVNYNIDHTEKRFRGEIAKWPDGRYEAEVFIDHDTLGIKDVKIQVACIVKGDQLTVDLTGTDDRPELVGVWNTFANSRGYVMTQIASAIDPSIVKNEGLFHAVEMIIPENTIAHPPVNKPAALGSFHPACEITEAVCLALSQVAPERSAPQVYKIGMPNAVIGFKHGQMWLDQGVDARTMDCIRSAGHRWLGLVPSGPGQSAVVGGGGCREPFSDHQHQPGNDHRFRGRRALARPTRQSECEEGTGTYHRDGVDGFGVAPAARAVWR